MDQKVTDKKVSKYGKPLGRPKGRRDSDLKKTIIGIFSRYRIPELCWRDFELARKGMTDKERWQASVTLMELGIKCAPKEISVSNSGGFSLIIEGLGQRQPLIVGEIVESAALRPIPAREALDAKQVLALLPPAPPLPPPPKDDRVQREIAREHARREAGDSPAHRPTGIF